MQSTGAIAAADPASAYGPGVAVRIPVFFHVITGTGGVGNVTDEQIVQQIAVLNSSFAAEGLYSFDLIGVSRVENDAWFNTICFKSVCGNGIPERNAKFLLVQDPRHIMNIYSTELFGDLEGMATYPFDYAYENHGYIPFDEDDYLNGIIVDFKTLIPGANPHGRDLGDTAVHEVGHYLGLLHPWDQAGLLTENGGEGVDGGCDGDDGPDGPTCSEFGDLVCDTPQHRAPAERPTDLPGTICQPGNTDETHNFMNLTNDIYKYRFTPGQHARMRAYGPFRSSLGQPAAPERVSAGVSVRLVPNGLVPNRTFRYGPAETLVVSGVLNADSVAFAERDPLRGWGGIYFTSTAGSSTAISTLSHVTVSGVRMFLPSEVSPASEEPIGAAVTVVNRNVVITGGSLIERGDAVNSGAMPVPDGTVFPTNGVQVAGLNGRLTVTGESTVRRHGGVGVLATGGGIASVTGQASILTNGFGGVLSTGYLSRVSVSGYAQVNDNSGPGIRASQQGFVSVRSPSGELSNTSASNNRGGLYTGSGAAIDAQQCDGSGNPTRPNRFVLNFANAFDASAFDGSVISAPYAFWGANRDSLVTTKDKSSTLALDNRVNDPNTPQPGCAVASERGAPGAGLVSAAALDDDTPQARGQVTDAVALLAAQARQAAWAGDMDAAFLQIDAARAAIVTDDDREAVSEATAALLADEQPADVVAGLAARAAAPGDDQAWAQRSLAIAYAAGNRGAEANALALTLSGSSDAAHAAFGHGVMVRLATDSDDSADAVDRLTAFAAIAPDADALGASVALVAATFPDADLSGVLGSAGRTAGRGTAAGTTLAVAARSADAAANVLDVFPNPAASGQATVRVTLAEATPSAVATVYDALGRQVTVLHAGSLAAGPSEFTLGALAPGVYVVHVRTAAEAGGVWTDVRRITVTR